MQKLCTGNKKRKTKVRMSLRVEKGGGRLFKTRVKEGSLRLQQGERQGRERRRG